MTEPSQPATLHAFIALAPPDDAKNELAHPLSPAYAAYPNLRWNRIDGTSPWPSWASNWCRTGRRAA
ncbi:hypothetical protein OG883_14480 [Streptomyces sp. NBC_01142]|uniref:hypothetical protein n=1 Tax=Streptomyces sp. NBC_01142 TaxID=2975865 RepID=UPI0022529654|nr:hypothetical protein [Streptomyces sp. NBC_01142]MCX4821097.1 hypothetical protein [Streptomyces sp. NBC_01142]